MVELVIVIVIAAATVWAIMWQGPREKDPDSTFWYAFAGLCCLLPAVLLPAIANPLAGAVLLGLAIFVAGASVLFMRKWTARVGDHERMEGRDAQNVQLSARHEAVVARWLSYELDTAKQIDFPAMNDVRIPETAALVKAMAEASALRRDASHPDRASETLLDYARAITRLETAFMVAETAATGAPGIRVISD